MLKVSCLQLVAEPDADCGRTHLHWKRVGYPVPEQLE